MPFRAACSVCVSDCDATAVLTNCQHFVCARCAAKVPNMATCPRCHKPCRHIRLNAAGFPPDIAERMQSDPLQQLKSCAQTFEFQIRQLQLSNQRLKELLTGLSGSNQQLAARCSGLEKEARSLKEENARIKEEFSAATRQISAFNSRTSGGTQQKILPSSPNPSFHQSQSPFRAPQETSNFNWSSPGVANNIASTPLGWGRTKRDRADDGGLDAGTPSAQDPFRLSTPAITATLRSFIKNNENFDPAPNGVNNSHRQQPPHPQQKQPLNSLLPQHTTQPGGARVIHSSSGHHGDPFTR